jgi:hypothetical protein
VTPLDRHRIVREESEMLVVSQGAHLAGVCVKCGTSEAIRPRFEVLQHAPSWTYALLPLGPLGIIAAAFLQRSGGVTLPICPACDERWRRAARRRSRVTLVLMPLTAAMVGAFVAEARGVLPEGAGAWVALVLVLVWVAAFAAVRLGKGRLAMVTAAGIDREILLLRGVHPDARRALVASHAIRRTLPPAG